MSLAELDALDIFPEDIAAFNQKGCRVQISASKFGRPIWIIPDTDKFQPQGEAIFHVHEVPLLVENQDSAAAIAAVKSHFPGELKTGETHAG